MMRRHTSSLALFHKISLSHRVNFPYHLGNGWFGGFLPTVAFAMVAASGDIYFGL